MQITHRPPPPPRLLYQEPALTADQARALFFFAYFAFCIN